jgi:hypothetical protein
LNLFCKDRFSEISLSSISLGNVFLPLFCGNLASSINKF